jgi:hypothetical protein
MEKAKVESTPKKKLIVPRIKQFEKVANGDFESNDDDDDNQVSLLSEKYIECIVARFLPVR